MSPLPEELTTEDLPEGRKVLEISCIFRPAVDGDANRFVDATIDAALEEGALSRQLLRSTPQG